MVLIGKLSSIFLSFLSLSSLSPLSLSLSLSLSFLLSLFILLFYSPPLLLLCCDRTTTLVANAVRLLLPTQIITTPGSPSTLLATVLQQGRLKYVVHLLHYVPRRIGASSVGIFSLRRERGGGERERREGEREREGGRHVTIFYFDAYEILLLTLFHFPTYV
jgi:hypothetical protein